MLYICWCIFSDIGKVSDFPYNVALGQKYNANEIAMDTDEASKKFKERFFVV